MSRKLLFYWGQRFSIHTPPLTCNIKASDASGTGLMSKDAKGWDWDKADEIDPKLRKCLPPIKGPNEVRIYL